MMKIRKAFNLKTLSVLLALTFALEVSAYGTGLLCLRLPLDNVGRVKKSLDNEPIKKRMEGTPEDRALRAFVAKEAREGRVSQRELQCQKELEEIRDQNIPTQRFRELASTIGEKIAPNIVPKNTAVLLPWRSGLSFAFPFYNRDCRDFWHLGVYRDERTFMPQVYYQNGWNLPSGVNDYQNLKVVIADPMLATGGTLIDAIEKVKEKGVPLENITICCIVSSPKGIANLLEKYPAIRIITAAIGHGLNEESYIVDEYGEPYLGDFGDRYFRGDDYEALAGEWRRAGIFTERDEIALLKRIEETKLASNSEIVSDILGRRGLRLLDLGTGSGEFLEAVDRLNPNAEVLVGIDPGISEVQKGKIERRRGGTKDPNRWQHHIRPAGSYDLVTIIYTDVSNIPDLISLFAAARAALKEDGRICVVCDSAPNAERAKSYMEVSRLFDNISILPLPEDWPRTDYTASGSSREEHRLVLGVKRRPKDTTLKDRDASDVLDESDPRRIAPVFDSLKQPLTSL